MNLVLLPPSAFFIKSARVHYLPRRPRQPNVTSLLAGTAFLPTINRRDGTAEFSQPRHSTRADCTDDRFGSHTCHRLFHYGRISARLLNANLGEFRAEQGRFTGEGGDLGTVAVCCKVTRVRVILGQACLFCDYIKVSSIPQHPHSIVAQCHSPITRRSCDCIRVVIERGRPGPLALALGSPCPQQPVAYETLAQLKCVTALSVLAKKKWKYSRLDPARASHLKYDNAAAPVSSKRPQKPMLL